MFDWTKRKKPEPKKPERPRQSAYDRSVNYDPSDYVTPNSGADRYESPSYGSSHIADLGSQGASDGGSSGSSD